MTSANVALSKHGSTGSTKHVSFHVPDSTCPSINTDLSLEEPTEEFPSFSISTSTDASSPTHLQECYSPRSFFTTDAPLLSDTEKPTKKQTTGYASIEKKLKTVNAVARSWLSISVFLKPISIPAQWIIPWLQNRSSQMTHKEAVRKATKIFNCLQKANLISMDRQKKYFSLSYMLPPEALAYCTEKKIPLLAKKTLKFLDKLSDNFDWEQQEKSNEKTYWITHAQFFCQQNLAQDCKTKVKMFNTLAHLFTAQGKYQEALRWALPCLCLARELRKGVAHPNIINAQWNLSIVHLNIGNVFEAQSCIKQAEEMLAEMKHRDEYDSTSEATPLRCPFDAMQARIYIRLTVELCQKGEFEQALETGERTQQMLLQHLPDLSQLDFAYLQEYIGICHMNLKNSEKAIEIQKCVLETRNQYYKDTPHPDLARSYEQIGSSYLCLGDPDYETALNMYTNARDQNLLLYPFEDHCALAKSYEQMGSCRFRLKQYDEAFNCYAKAIVIRNKACPHKPSLDIASSYEQMGYFHYHLKQYKEALKCHQTACEIRNKVHNDRPHADTAHSCEQSGHCHRALGEYSEALYCYNLALTTREKVFPNQPHIDTARAWRYKGLMLAEQGRFKNAQQSYTEALKMRRQIHNDENHPEVVESRQDINSITSRSDSRFTGNRASPKRGGMWQLLQSSLSTKQY